ncbi:bifunctional diaminohydroxyphosphoribosylaminopyrimidine deaminase/5-amino-6-(5-phosphoribosylamino)uracil reductase RibD [Acinetobacter sp. WCHAc060033]|uniref:bifunctional diaminohydroxyphosphoribosylaminopyrimidine deaminase/5-amino-6-(5-phosphoribosylamino)uracil reductase RibD n=1 Tax=Acinetobacter sp. WCHAc060033 TaxID=2518624 RepID=UPI001022B9CA|nr:bifunctional diaminohydroxyphosphoribosylaminopyrimidine deaminase/5-amino-6-(5-phosphoribosylamino)uracil reductase RibD [Acinetobacter sp. WCHAc060033]RZG88668.1 bifunctional diaminohydroxyphosphoribosylaminopyrimidine deaminase/5-amino-6-(5-phosphoribosylamino)uracil reductase RibD [Acinetobacter sp. WCHAc060033]
MSEYALDSKHNDALSEDQVWMRQAIAEAEKAIYRTRPNPAVGCVIVKDGVIVGRGATAPVGGSHAEVFAMCEAGELAQGATAYVTLEPCAHYGRTPPCAKGLVEAGIAKVVVACADPNPLVAGKGIEILRQAGIHVITDVCTAKAEVQNKGFLKAMACNMPYVRLKVASSLDGRTAMASGESKWITGAESRQDVQHWRAISGAVITGIETILADDPLLNVRSLFDADGKVIDLDTIVQPKRVILDRQGRLPLTAQILKQPDTVMVMGPFRQELAELGVVQLEVQSLQDLLRTLKDFQIYDVLVEAGATLSTAFLQEKLVDELISYVAPTLLGQSARAMFNAQFESMAQQLRFKLADVHQFGDDIRLRLIPSQESV